MMQTASRYGSLGSLVLSWWLARRRCRGRRIAALAVGALLAVAPAIAVAAEQEPAEPPPEKPSAEPATTARSATNTK